MRELTVVIGYVETWSPKYRLQFSDSTNKGLLSRFDIEELSYVGSVTDVKGGSQEPVILDVANDGGVDPFYPVFGSSCAVTLMSETDEQFEELVSYSEKKYRGTYYVYESGSYVKKWQGFLTPQSGSEPYVMGFNYPVTFVFTDGLKDLENKEFSDDSGNKVLSRISVLRGIIYCLNKTNLRLGFKETVNLYPNGIDTSSTASVLDQIYFDPLVYEQEDGTMESCLSVLNGLLLSLCASLCQSGGYWHVSNVTLKSRSVVPTRTLASDGGTVSGDDVDWKIKLRKATAPSPKIVFREQGAFKEYPPMYGELEFTIDYGLIKDNNILKSGNFEDEDIANGQLKNWQIDNTDAPFVTCSIDEIPNKESRKALKIPFRITSGITAQQVVIIKSSIVKIYPQTQTDKIVFSFDALPKMLGVTIERYCWIDFTVRANDGIEDFFMTPVPNLDENTVTFGQDNFDDLVDGRYNRVYIDNDNEWANIKREITYNKLTFNNATSVDLQVEFRLSCNPLWDLKETAPESQDLSDVLTFGSAQYPIRTYANRKRVLASDGGNLVIRYYELEASTESSDYPNIIVPDDNSTMRWKLKYTIPRPTASPLNPECWIGDLFLDNVQLAYMPNQENPPSTQVTTVILSPNIKNKLEITFRHNDLPSDQNYRAISRGWFSKSDGEPTPTFWKIKGNPPSDSFPRSLISRVSGLYSGQYQVIRWKLSGNVQMYGAIPFAGQIVYEVRTGRIYSIVGVSISPKAGYATIQIVEILKGAATTDESETPDPGVEPPAGTPDFFIDDFEPADFFAEI